jgi:hypothetical protein
MFSLDDTAKPMNGMKLARGPGCTEPPAGLQAIEKRCWRHAD